MFPKHRDIDVMSSIFLQHRLWQDDKSMYWNLEVCRTFAIPPQTTQNIHSYSLWTLDYVSTS